VKDQIADYSRKISPADSLKKRLETLARIRTAEGYMAELKAQKDGSFLLIENHCPICVAARMCQNLCSGEMEVFRAVLGKVEIVRTEHIVNGTRRCAYRISNLR
jgi:predicted ArsR family transcriptional regulator